MIRLDQLALIQFYFFIYKLRGAAGRRSQDYTKEQGRRSQD